MPIIAEMGGALGRLIANEALACVVDLSELGSSAARRRFMAAFSEALYEANEEPLHLVRDEADLWLVSISTKPKHSISSAPMAGSTS